MLERVTITGADDGTSVEEMLALSRRYPFVEWGILVSKRHEGSPRFPSRKWMVALVEAAMPDKETELLNLSTHICGAWVREMFVGKMDWTALPMVASVSQRVQINTHAEEHVSTRRMMDTLEQRSEAQFIFQWDGVNDHLIYAAKACALNVAALFDTSGGAGVLPEKWIAPADEFPCGYAGGLGPDNVLAQIAKIEAVCAKPYWIDMERRVRTQDDSALDMDAVRSVLEQAEGLFAPRAIPA
jgi:phosphoribosylanthranilate isomerase